MTSSPPSGRRAEEIAIGLYKQVYRHGSASVDEAAKVLNLSDEELSAGEMELLRLGLLSMDGSDPPNLVVVPPEGAIVQILERDRQTLARYRDAMADTIGALEEIVEHFLPLGPGPRQDLELEVIAELPRVASVLDMMTNLARDELLSMHPGPMPSEQVLRDGRARDRLLIERGLRIRTIYAKHVTNTAYVRAYLDDLVSFGYQVRTAPTLPMRMIICDGQRALIPLDLTNGRAGAIAIDGEMLVRSLVKVFEHCWQSSSRLEESAESASGLTEQELTTLRMLAVGMKDEQIARSIGVSVRTVSRTVSDLMRRLDAQSRFQAGVRAFQAGWVE
jgi:DNA-binding CsgD family transcriptional regulator